MPVTIGNMTSNVNVVDGNNTLSEAAIEKITQQVMMRLKAEQYDEEQRRQDQKPYSQATTPEPL
jgi:hypothetical protein